MRDHYSAFLQYLDEKVMDHVHGSWFHQMDQHNQLLTTVWPGKSDLYHATQAMLIPLYRKDLSIARAVRDGAFC
jgi:mannose/cellobiose epimerase-like protein (N-acyl-D-glucosamine 2-epimerase family)